MPEASAARMQGLRLPARRALNVTQEGTGVAPGGDLIALGLDGGRGSAWAALAVMSLVPW